MAVVEKIMRRIKVEGKEKTKKEEKIGDDLFYDVVIL